MAKAKKHEMTKEELRAPDEIEVALKGFWEKLYGHRKLIIIGVGALVAIGIVSWVIGASKRSGIESRAVAVRDASLAIGAGIGPDEVKDPEIAKLPRPPRFADEAARVTASNEALAKFMAERGGDDAAELVAIAAANAKLNKGDAAGALADAEAWLAAHAKSPALPVALELKARAQAAAGQNDAAVATLDELSKQVGGTFKAEILTRLGDLQNPVLNDGKGDAAKAKTAYQAALATLPPDAEPDKLQIGGKQGLRGTVENRLGLIP